MRVTFPTTAINNQRSAQFSTMFFYRLSPKLAAPCVLVDCFRISEQEIDFPMPAWSVVCLTTMKKKKRIFTASTAGNWPGKGLRVPISTRSSRSGQEQCTRFAPNANTGRMTLKTAPSQTKPNGRARSHVSVEKHQHVFLMPKCSWCH